MAKKNPVSAYLAKIGKNGGRARASSLTAAQRKAAAQRAVNVRWSKRKKKTKAKP